MKNNLERTIELKECLELAGISLLFVDDDAVNRLLAGRILSKFGAQVECRGSYCDAVKFLRDDSKKADVVLLDRNLSNDKFSGIDLAKLIKQKNENMPIIMITGRTELSEEEKKLFVAVMDKPFGMDDLVQTIRNCTKKEIENKRTDFPES
jgi:DNA-binding NtrC family response regulator